MPTLEWIGKEKVINHHQEVPFRVLDRQYSFDENGQHAEEKVNCAEGAREAALGRNGSENMIIHGDNLEALKALLPRYEGRVKCIYIDPPYNTGEEGWIYNDNVNDPKIKKWLGEVVGKEGEDLTRHDKWLCMMYPRLKILYKLLSDDGIIAVSINDNELFNLGAIMNEIFGSFNRLACAPFRSEPSGGKDKSALRTGHEYILFYTKGDTSNLSKEEKSTGELNLKDKWGSYRKGRELRKWGATSDRADRPNLWFAIATPSGELAYPYKNDGSEGYWRWGKENAGMMEILKDPEAAHWEYSPYDNGVTVNGKTHRWVPYEKIRDAKKSFGWNSWLDGYGTNADGTAVIKAIFGTKIFDTPKPLSLIEWIVSLYGEENALVLDSFAGSGTTAHAVLNMNKADGGNRKFILVEMEDYADSITAERVRRVIRGYGEGKNAVEGTGGSFSYYELGEPLLIGENLNEAVEPEKIREYIWFMETKTPYTPAAGENLYYLGKHNDTGYYFYYEPQRITVLDYDFLATVTEKAGGTVIYADRCSIDDSKLSQMGIVFKKIPRDISRL